jgi:DNA-3-methyladenine glycosylase
MDDRLPHSFFAQDTVLVAKALIGTRLVRQTEKQRIAGIITETEAYRGEEDLACHARAGRTPRTEVMYGPPGAAYVYFVYGMHWLLNFVTEIEGAPGAVLIRAIFPVEGLDIIAWRRNGKPRKHWTDGPAKLCQALGIDGSINGMDTCGQQATVFVERGISVKPSQIQTSTRVGLNTVPEPWRSKPWRFVLKDHNFFHSIGSE